ncbi:MAG TPA: hypothetical protein ENG87_01735 [Candidatus Pacearchaeota archaeon]|nr:hypothetical protein [Candidatus Pacearchaeota archaeon]
MVVNFQKVLKENKELKKKKSKKDTKKLLNKKITSKSVLKPSQMTITIKKQEPYNVLDEPNRFFKHEFEETKRSLFFS